MSPTTLLLSGATGFLGRHTLAALQGEGRRIVCLTRTGAPLQGADEVLRCDFNEPQQLLELESRRADVIVHLAADVALGRDDDAALFLPNVATTCYLAHLARSWRARLIFTSSIGVHGIRAERIAGDCPIEPADSYARSKALGEQLIASSGAEHVILRMSGVFGAHGPAHLGINRAIDGALNGIVPTLVGDGRALRNYVYVKDAAHAVAAAVQGDLHGLHYLAGAQAVSIREMLETICDVLMPGAVPISKDGAPGRDQVVVGSTELPTGRSFKDALLDIQAMRHATSFAG